MIFIRINDTTSINAEIIALVLERYYHGSLELDILTKNGKTYTIQSPTYITKAVEQLGL